MHAKPLKWYSNPEVGRKVSSRGQIVKFEAHHKYRASAGQDTAVTEVSVAAPEELRSVEVSRVAVDPLDPFVALPFLLPPSPQRQTTPTWAFELSELSNNFPVTLLPVALGRSALKTLFNGYGATAVRDYRHKLLRRYVLQGTGIHLQVRHPLAF